MHRTFDLVVIGAGVAATAVATKCRAAGWSVAIMDQLPVRRHLCPARLRPEESAPPRRVEHEAHKVGVEIADRAHRAAGEAADDQKVRVLRQQRLHFLERRP